MKALFIGAHVDEELCFAGAMQNYESHCLTFFTGSAWQDEFQSSMNIIGCSHDLILRRSKLELEPQAIADILYFRRDDYDIIFTHSVDDRHPLHRMVAEESLRVFNCSLITYTGPWNGPENANYFVELTEEQLEKKIAALACYKSQAHRPYMDPEFIRAWARYNGIKCGKKYAEGFHTQRLIV